MLAGMHYFRYVHVVYKYLQVNLMYRENAVSSNRGGMVSSLMFKIR